MLRKRILAAATATVLALGMSVGGAGAAFAGHQSPGTLPVWPGVTLTVEKGLTCNEEGYTKTDEMDQSSGTYDSDWGSISWGSGVFTWDLTPGYDVDFCVKGATIVAAVDSSAIPSGSYDFEEHVGHGISHVGIIVRSTPPPPVDVAGSVTTTPENCLDGDGSIVFGGDEGVVYTFDGVQYFPGDSATGLVAGDYTVAVAAASGAYTLTSPASVDVTVGSTQENCPVGPVDVAGSVTPTPENCLDSNGSIVFGGDDGVVYTLDGVEYFPGDTATGLVAGTYTVTVDVVSDDYALTSPASVDVEVTATEVDCPVNPVPVEGSVVPTAENCFDGNGGLTFSGDEGVVFTFQGETYLPGDTVNGLVAGDYTVEVAAASDDYTLTSPASLDITVDSTQEDCAVASFSADVLAGGECEADVPWIDITFSIDPGDLGLNSDGAFLEFRKAGFSSEFANFDGPNAAVWKIVDGERVLVPNGLITEGGDYEARVLWPGASVDSEGNPTGWPGWDFSEELGWFETEDDENARWTRGVGVDPTVQLFLSVNPVAEIDVMAAEFTYPPATPDCAAEPPFDFPTLPLVEPEVTSTMATCEASGTYTLSDTEGVVWLVGGEQRDAGTYTATTGSTVDIQATALDGFGFGFETQTEWSLSFPAPSEDCDLTDLPTLALTGASGMAGTVGIVALLITLTGMGAVVARRRLEA